MKAITRAFRRYSSPLADTAQRIFCPEAHTFYTRLIEEGYQPNVLIDVLPEERVIYVCVPKCASARIKKTLSSLHGRHIRSSEEAYERQHSGLKNPKRVGLSTFSGWPTTRMRCVFPSFAIRMLAWCRCGRISSAIGPWCPDCRLSTHT